MFPIYLTYLYANYKKYIKGLILLIALFQAYNGYGQIHSYNKKVNQIGAKFCYDKLLNIIKGKSLNPLPYSFDSIAKQFRSLSFTKWLSYNEVKKCFYFNEPNIIVVLGRNINATGYGTEFYDWIILFKQEKPIIFTSLDNKPHLIFSINNSSFGDKITKIFLLQSVERV